MRQEKEDLQQHMLQVVVQKMTRGIRGEIKAMRSSIKESKPIVESNVGAAID